MGSQIALRLALRGHKVTVFNWDKSKAEKLRSANSSITLNVANQPSDIGSNCDIALICVKDYEVVSNVRWGSPAARLYKEKVRAKKKPIAV